MSDLCEFIDYPVFITGNATSGTTLLRNLLDGHDDLMVLPVQMSLRAFVNDEGLLNSNFSIDNFFETGPTTGIFSLSLNKDSVESGCRDYTDIDFHKFKKLVLDKWDGATGKSLQEAVIKGFFESSKYKSKAPKMWIEKTHGNEKLIELFLEWYPNVRIVHIIRDPYDNFSSYRKKTKQQGGIVDVVSHAAEWARSIDNVLEAHQLYSDKILILQFEQLLKHPRKELTRVCDFLGIEYSPVMQVPTTYGVDWSGNSQLKEKFDCVSVKPIGSHKKNNLSLENIDIIATMVNRYSLFTYWDYPVRSIFKLTDLTLKELIIVFSIKYNCFPLFQKMYRIFKL